MDPSKWKSRTIGWIWLSMLPIFGLIGYWIANRTPTVVEIETDRLVCAVTRRSISCVPKIPGLFEERIEQ